MASQETCNIGVTNPGLIPISQWNAAADWWSLIQFKEWFLRFQNNGLGISIPYVPDFGKECISRLLCLHEYGLLGISCQGTQLPGSPERLLDSETWEEQKQKQYLEFFIPYEGEETTKKFIGLLLKDSSLRSVIFDRESTKLVGSSEILWVPVENPPDVADSTCQNRRRFYAETY